MGPSQFDLLKYVDQGKVFGKVHKALAHGKCLGVSVLLVPPPCLLGVRCPYSCGVCPASFLDILC